MSASTRGRGRSRFPVTASDRRLYAGAMIAAVHTVLYAHDAEAARAFFRDVLGMDSVDSGDGWLIFALPPAELARHPGAGRIAGRGVGGSGLFLMCPAVEAPAPQLEAAGFEFPQPVAAQGYGLVPRFRVPGSGELGLYEPRHVSPLAGF